MILGEVRNKRGVRAMQEMWSLPRTSEAGRSSSGQAPAVADMSTNAHGTHTRPEPLPSGRYARENRDLRAAMPAEKGEKYRGPSMRETDRFSRSAIQL